LPKQADPTQPLLVVDGLKTYFSLDGRPFTAVDGVSFRLDQGEALGIAGESGCGKTTTALSLVRLLPRNARIEAGSIRYFGSTWSRRARTPASLSMARDLDRLPGRDERPQPGPRLRDQIAEPLMERLNLSEKVARTRAGELLELVGIPKKRGGAYPHELSGGMRQRAMIAMALACDPAIVIGDEPTTALDVMIQAQILELLERLRHELGLSMIRSPISSKHPPRVAASEAGRSPPRGRRRRGPGCAATRPLRRGP